MATWRMSINPGDTLENITAAAGAAIVTKNIELTVDLGNDITDGAAAVTPRPIKRGEIVEALVKLMQWVEKDTTFLQ
jgi:hypothetical protein